MFYLKWISLLLLIFSCRVARPSVSKKNRTVEQPTVTAVLEEGQSLPVFYGADGSAATPSISSELLELYGERLLIQDVSGSYSFFWENAGEWLSVANKKPTDAEEAYPWYSFAGMLGSSEQTPAAILSLNEQYGKQNFRLGSYEFSVVRKPQLLIGSSSENTLFFKQMLQGGTFSVYKIDNSDIQATWYSGGQQSASGFTIPAAGTYILRLTWNRGDSNLEFEYSVEVVSGSSIVTPEIPILAIQYKNVGEYSIFPLNLDQLAFPAPSPSIAFQILPFSTSGAHIWQQDIELEVINQKDNTLNIQKTTDGDWEVSSLAPHTKYAFSFLKNKESIGQFNFTTRGQQGSEQEPSYCKKSSCESPEKLKNGSVVYLSSDAEYTFSAQSSDGSVPEWWWRNKKTESLSIFSGTEVQIKKQVAGSYSLTLFIDEGTIRRDFEAVVDGVESIDTFFLKDENETPLTTFELLDEKESKINFVAQTLNKLSEPHLQWVLERANIEGIYIQVYPSWLGANEDRKLDKWEDSKSGYANAVKIEQPGQYRACAAASLTSSVCSEAFYRLQVSIENTAKSNGGVPGLIANVKPSLKGLNYFWKAQDASGQETIIGVDKELTLPLEEYESLNLELWLDTLPDKRVVYEYEDLTSIYRVEIEDSPLLDGHIPQGVKFSGQEGLALKASFIDLKNRVKSVKFQLDKENSWLSLNQIPQINEQKREIIVSPIENSSGDNFHVKLYFRWNFSREYDNNQLQIQLLDDRQDVIQTRSFNIFSSNISLPPPQLCLGVSSCEEDEAVKLTPREEKEVYDVPTLFTLADSKDQIANGHASYLKGYIISSNVRAATEKEILWLNGRYQPVVLSDFFSGDTATLRLVPQIEYTGRTLRLAPISYKLKRKDKAKLEFGTLFSELEVSSLEKTTAGLWYNQDASEEEQDGQDALKRKWYKFTPGEETVVQLDRSFSLVVYDPKATSTPSVTLSGSSVALEEKESSHPWRRWSFTISKFQNSNSHKLITSLDEQSLLYLFKPQKNIILSKEVYGEKKFLLRDKVYWRLQPFNFELSDPNKLIKSIGIENEDGISFSNRSSGACRLGQVQNSGSINPGFCGDFEIKQSQATFTLVAKDDNGTQIFEKNYTLQPLWKDASWTLLRSGEKIDPATVQIKVDDELTLKGRLDFPGLNEQQLPTRGYTLQWCEEGTQNCSTGNPFTVPEAMGGKELSLGIKYETLFSKGIPFRNTVKHVATVAYDDTIWRLEGLNGTEFKKDDEDNDTSLLSGLLERGRPLSYNENGLKDTAPTGITYKLYQGSSYDSKTLIANDWDASEWKNGANRWQNLEKEWVGKKLFFDIEYTAANGSEVQLRLSSRATIARNNLAPVWQVNESSVKPTPKEDTALKVELSDKDIDPMTANISYKWFSYQNKEPSSPPSYLSDTDNWKNISVGASYTPQQSDVDLFLAVEASYKEIDGTLQFAYYYFAKVENTNDEPQISINGLEANGSAEQLSTLSVSIKDEDGYKPNNVTYSWKRNGTPLMEISNTSSSYTVQQADVGKTLSVDISYTDVWGTSETETISIDRIDNTFPSGKIHVKDTLSDDNSLPLKFISRTGDTVKLLANQKYSFSFGDENTLRQHPGIQYRWSLLEGDKPPLNFNADEQVFSIGSYTLTLALEEGGDSGSPMQLEIEVRNFDWRGAGIEGSWNFTQADAAGPDLSSISVPQIDGLKNTISVTSPFEDVESLIFEKVSLSTGRSWKNVDNSYWELEDLNQENSIANSIRLAHGVGKAQLQFLRAGIYRIGVDLLAENKKLTRRYLYLQAIAGSQDALILSERRVENKFPIKNSNDFENLLTSYNKGTLSSPEYSLFLSRAPDSTSAPSPLQVYKYDNLFTLYLPASYAGKSYEFFEDSSPRSLIKSTGTFIANSGLVELPLNFRRQNSPSGIHSLTLKIYEPLDGKPDLLAAEIPFNILWLAVAEVGFAEFNSTGELTGDIQEGNFSKTSRLQFKASNSGDGTWRYRLKRRADGKELIYDQNARGWREEVWSLSNNFGFVAPNRPLLPTGKYLVQAQQLSTLNKAIAITPWTELEHIPYTPEIETYSSQEIELNKGNLSQDILLTFNQQVSYSRSPLWQSEQQGDFTNATLKAVTKNGFPIIDDGYSRYHRLTLSYADNKPLAIIDKLPLILYIRNNSTDTITIDLKDNIAVKADTQAPQIEKVEYSSNGSPLASSTLIIGQEIEVTIETNEEVTFDVKTNNRSSVANKIKTVENPNEKTYTFSYTVKATDIFSENFKIIGTIEDSLGNKTPVNLNSSLQVDSSRPILRALAFSTKELKRNETTTLTLFFSEAIAIPTGSNNVSKPDLTSVSTNFRYRDALAETILLTYEEDEELKSSPLSTFFTVSWPEEKAFQNEGATIKLKLRPKVTQNRNLTKLSLSLYQDLAGNEAINTAERSIAFNLNPSPLVTANTQIIWSDKFLEDEKKFYTSARLWVPRFLTASNDHQVAYCLGENCLNSLARSITFREGVSIYDGEELSLSEGENIFNYQAIDSNQEKVDAVTRTIVYDATPPPVWDNLEPSFSTEKTNFFNGDELKLQQNFNIQNLEKLFYRYRIVFKGSTNDVWKPFPGEGNTGLLTSSPILKIDTSSYRGEYTLYLRVTDRAGNSEEKSYQFDFDAQIPLVRSTFEQESENITLIFSERLKNFSKEGNIQLLKDDISYDNYTLIKRIDPRIFSLSGLFEDGDEKEVTLTLRLNDFRDLAGNKNSYSKTLTIDRRLPEITVRRLRSRQSSDDCQGEMIPLTSSPILIGGNGLCMDFNINLASIFDANITGSTPFTLKEDSREISNSSTTLTPDTLYTLVWTPQAAATGIKLAAGVFKTKEGKSRPNEEKTWQIEIDSSLPKLSSSSFEKLRENTFQWQLKFDKPVKPMALLGRGWLGNSYTEQDIVSISDKNFSQVYLYRFNTTQQGNLTLEIPQGAFKDELGNSIAKTDVQGEIFSGDSTALLSIETGLSLHFYKKEKTITLEFNRALQRLSITSPEVTITDTAVTTSSCDSGNTCYTSKLTAKDGQSGDINLTITFTDLHGNSFRIEKKVGNIDTKKEELTIESIDYSPFDDSQTPVKEPAFIVKFSIAKTSKIVIYEDVTWSQFNGDLFPDNYRKPKLEQESTDSSQKYTLTFPLKRGLNKALKFYFPVDFLRYDVPNASGSLGELPRHLPKNIIFTYADGVSNAEKELDTTLNIPQTQNNLSRQLNFIESSLAFELAFDEEVTIEALSSGNEAIKFEKTSDKGDTHYLILSLESSVDSSDLPISFEPSLKVKDSQGNIKKISLSQWRVEASRLLTQPTVTGIGISNADTNNPQNDEKFYAVRVENTNTITPLTMTAIVFDESGDKQAKRFTIPQFPTQQNLLIPVSDNSRKSYKILAYFENEQNRTSATSTFEFLVDLAKPELSLEKSALNINSSTEKHSLELYSKEKISSSVELLGSLATAITAPIVKYEKFDGSEYHYSLTLDSEEIARLTEKKAGFAEINYKDESGNSGATKFLPIIIDVTSPEVSTISPQEPKITDINYPYIDLSFNFSETVKSLKDEYLQVYTKASVPQLLTGDARGKFTFLRDLNSNTQQVRYTPPQGENSTRVIKLKEAYDLSGNPLAQERTVEVEYDLEKPQFLGTIFPTSQRIGAKFDIYLAFSEPIQNRASLLSATKGNIAYKGDVIDEQKKKKLLDSENIVDENVTLYKYEYSYNSSNSNGDGAVEFSLLPYEDFSKNRNQNSNSILKTILVDITPPRLISSRIAENNKFVAAGKTKTLLFTFSEKVRNIVFNTDSKYLKASSNPAQKTVEGFSYEYIYTPPDNAEGRATIAINSFKDLFGNSNDTNDQDPLMLVYDTRAPRLLEIKLTDRDGNSVNKINLSSALQDGQVQKFNLDFVFDEEVLDPGYNISFSGGILQSYDSKESIINGEYIHRYIYIPNLHEEEQEISFSLREFNDFFKFEDKEKSIIYIANTALQSLVSPIELKVKLDTQAPIMPAIENFFYGEPEQFLQDGGATQETVLGTKINIQRPQKGILHLENLNGNLVTEKPLTEEDGSIITIGNLRQRSNNTVTEQLNIYQAWLTDEYGNSSQKSKVASIYYDNRNPSTPNLKSLKDGVLELDGKESDEWLRYKIRGYSVENEFTESLLAEILLPQREYQNGDVELWYVDKAGNIGASYFWPRTPITIESNSISAHFIDTESAYITVAQEYDKDEYGYSFAPMYAVVDQKQEWEYSLDAGKTWSKGDKEGFFNVPAVDGGFLSGNIQVYQNGSLWSNPEPVVVLEWAPVRIAAFWDTFADVDAYLYAPQTNDNVGIGYENPIYYNNNRLHSSDQFGKQDRSELNFYGPETFSLHRLLSEKSYFLLLKMHNNSWGINYQTSSNSSAATREYNRLQGTADKWRTEKTEIKKRGTVAQVYISFQLPNGQRISKLFKTPYPMVFNNNTDDCSDILYGQNGPAGSDWQEQRTQGSFTVPEAVQKKEWRALSFKVSNIGADGYIKKSSDITIKNNWAELDENITARAIKQCSSQ